MPFQVVNQSTATLVANLLKEGRIAYFSPLVDFGTALPHTSWADFGYFPPDALIAPNNTVNRTAVTASNREGGPDVTLSNDVTSLSISYDTMPALTPDDNIRRLHAGSTPTTLTVTALAGTQAFGIDPSATFLGRMIILRKRPPVNGSRVHQVVFHPRVALSGNGTGDSNGKETLIFKADVQPFDWAPPTALGGNSFGQYGARFEVADNKLQALLDELSDEALAS